jgi:uncharacterized protein
MDRPWYGHPDWTQLRGVPVGARVTEPGPVGSRATYHHGMTMKMIRILICVLMISSSAGLAEELPPDLRHLIQSANEQVGATLYYDPSYAVIPFPGGDVPIVRGVCTDVIIRAYRHVGIDLQLLVNQDMRKAFRAYPRKWGLTHPDPNIDHRRVENLAVFFARHGQTLPISMEPKDYRLGDIVTWRLSDGHPHIGLVSDRSTDGRPLIVHNIGAGARIEDVLFAFTITGHYRYLPDKD